MTTKQIRRMIVSKFGTITMFTHLAGMDYQNFMNFLRSAENIEEKVQQGREELKQLKESLRKTAVIINRLKIEPEDQNLLTPQHRAAIRQEIRKKYNTVKEFCEHEEFNDSSVNTIISGGTKKITPLAVKIMERLSIDIVSQLWCWKNP